MAGPAGLILGLPGLFLNCVHCFDLIQLARAQDRDVQLLHTMLDAQKIRFRIWGEALGLGTDDSLLAHEREYVQEQISRMMQSIIDLLKEGQDLAERYGLRRDESLAQATVTDDRAGRALRRLVKSMQPRFGASSEQPQRDSARWVISDRKRFLELVNYLRHLVDGLEGLTHSPTAKAARQALAQREVADLSLSELDLVVTAAGNSSNVLSDAASSRIEMLTLSTEGISSAQPYISARQTPSPQPGSHLAGRGPASYMIAEDVDSSAEQTNPSNDSHADAPIGSRHLQRSVAHKNNDYRFTRDNAIFEAVVIADRRRLGPIEKRHAQSASLAWTPDLYSSTSEQVQRRPILRDVWQELQSFTRDVAEENISLSPIEGDFGNFLGSIAGLAGSPYEGGTFFVHIRVSSDFPQKAPQARFLTRVYHPNIDPKGKVCVDVLAYEGSALLGLRTLLLSIAQVLHYPSVEDPLVPEIAAQWREDVEQYNDNARLYTKQYAMQSSPSDAVLQGCLVP